MDDPEDSAFKSPFERITELESALRRVDRSFDLLLRGKPVRGVAEMKAEIADALRATITVVPDER